jgi:hypothetical protein
MVPWEELCAGATVEIDCGCSDVSGRPGDFVRGGLRAPPSARGSSTLCGSMVVMVSPLSTSERF